jgi:hypothetical protein
VSVDSTQELCHRRTTENALGNAAVLTRPGRQTLDPEQATERPTGIVRFRTVVIHENRVVAAITKECAAEFSDITRGFHPARRFGIEISKFLQLSILFLG